MRGSIVVEVIVKGDKTLSSIKVNDKSLLCEEKSEQLFDLIVVAANKACAEIDKFTDVEIAKITKGCGIPGMSNFPGL